MARRLSTKYYFMELDNSGQQFEEFITILKKNHFPTEVKVFENGDSELILSAESEDIPISFRNMGTFYKLESSCTINNWDLAHLMQKIIRQFKGKALVHRIYAEHTIEYLYYKGKVAHIIELKNGEKRIIYQLSVVTDPKNHSFNSQVIKDQISWIYLQIDQLLDKRLKASWILKNKIDSELTQLCHQLLSLKNKL